MRIASIDAVGRIDTSRRRPLAPPPAPPPTSSCGRPPPPPTANLHRLHRRPPLVALAAGRQPPIDPAVGRSRRWPLPPPATLTTSPRRQVPHPPTTQPKTRPLLCAPLCFPQYSSAGSTPAPRATGSGASVPAPAILATSAAVAVPPPFYLRPLCVPHTVGDLWVRSFLGG